MKTCKLFLCVILTCGVYCAYAQQAASDGGKRSLPLSVWVFDNIDGMTSEAQNNLRNKLTQIASKQGVATDPGHSRFILTANVVVQEKYITSTAPPKQAYKLDITFYIGDGLEGKVFASHTSSVSGVGNNETKAYMDALKGIKVADPAYKRLMDLGTSKIIAYFNTQCDFVIREAQTLTAAQKYEEALWRLTSVPDVCADCWKRAIDEADAVYQQKIDRECKFILSEANNIWNAGQNVAAAEKAGAVLVNIDPSSNCFDEAMVLSRKIAQRIKEMDDKEEAEKKEALAFQRKMQEEELAFQRKVKEEELALQRKKQEKDVEVEQERIKVEQERIQVYRDASIAWAKNQVEPVVYKPFW